MTRPRQSARSVPLVGLTTRFADAYVRLEERVLASLLRYTRTAIPYASLDDLERSFDACCAEMDRLGRVGFALLVDLREAKGTNDPAFEKAIARPRRRLVSGFRRVAVLVQTASGALQMRRHASEDGVDMRVFTDEGEALAFLEECI